MEPLSDFNRKRISDILGNDYQLMSDVFEIVNQDFPDHVAALDHAIHMQDYETVYERAHTLKGSLANLGAERGSSLAAAVLKAADAGNFSKCRDLYPAIKDSVEQFLAEFEEYIARK